MSEASRQRWLHVTNRLAELRAKYGREIEEIPMPDWLDLAQDAQEQAQAEPAATEAAEEVAEEAPPQNRVVERSGGKPRGADW